MYQLKSIEKALQLYRIRPPTSSFLQTDENNNVFTASITIAEYCSTSGCSAHSFKKLQQQILECMMSSCTLPTFGTIVPIAKLRGG